MRVSRSVCKAEAILPAYGMAETTLAVSFSECGAGLVVDEVDADLLAALRQAVPATKGNTRRLASLGPLLKDIEARIVDEHGNLMPARGVGRHRVARRAADPGLHHHGRVHPGAGRARLV